MRVDGGVPGCACQALPLPIGDVLAIGHHVFLGKTEIKDEQLVFMVFNTHAEVVRFDVSV